MPISLGDFFANAPYARPVNARPVTFTAMSRSKILPGGHPNPSGRAVAAKITAAFCFLGGEGAAQARVATRKALRERFVDKETKFPLPTDDADFDIELTYQILQAVLREYDEASMSVGVPLFPTVEIARDLLEVQEANRIMRAYNAYVADEHPEAVDQKSFRGAAKAGEEMAPVTPR